MKNLCYNKIVSKSGFYKEGEKQKTFIYRIHDKPDEDKINSLYDIIKKFGYSINKVTQKIYLFFKQSFKKC